MTVSNTTSSIGYTGTGTTATYAFTWAIAAAADLIVYTASSATTPYTLLVLNAGYTVTGAGAPGGGTITLTSGNLGSGSKLFIASDPSQIQAVLLEQGAAINPADVMAALDLLTREVQANRRLASVSLQIPVAESRDGRTVILPEPASRAGLVPTWTAAGDLTLVPLSSTTVTLTSVATVAALKQLATPAATTVYATDGYAAAGDGGHGLYYWSAADTTADNGGTIIALNAGGTGRFHLLAANGAFNVKQFGAKGDATTDDTTAIQRTITAAQLLGGSVIFPPAVYRTTASLLVSANCALIGGSKPGPRVYTSTSVYGGAEIRGDWAPVTNSLVSAFALQVDVGSIGSEGYANVLVQGIGFGHTGAKGGGIYVEGSQAVTIKECRFTGDIDQWTAGTADGIGIYARDMIVSRISDCQFFRMGWGIVADDYFNENVVEHCDFFNCYQLPVGICAVTNDSIRNTIRCCNFLGDPGGVRATYGIKLGGLVTAMTIEECTFEAIRDLTIRLDNLNPLTGGVIAGGAPRGVTVQGCAFIACVGATAGGANVSVGSTTSHVVVARNTVKSPTVNDTALVNFASTAAYLACYANDLGGIAEVSGDPTKSFIDTQLYRSLPQDTSEATKSAWTTDNTAALWQNTNGRIRAWNGYKIGTVPLANAVTDAASTGTPDVRGVSVLICNGAGAYNITDLLNGYAGQDVLIYNQAAGSSPTVKQGTHLKLSGSADKVLAVSGGRLVLRSLDGTTWVQVDTMISP